MARIVIPMVLVVLLGVVLYASQGTFDTVSAIALTTRDIFFPQKKEPAASTQLQTLSPFAAKFGSHLMIMDDGVPRGLDSSKLTGIKYWAFYYSASWCPPCRAFTPDLVSFYKEFKPSHPDFELVFVSDDRNEGDMLNYMKGDSMTWPAVWFADTDNSGLGLRKYSDGGIPCLVLVDADGRVLSDTFQGWLHSSYTDPHHVIDDIRTMVKE